MNLVTAFLLWSLVGGTITALLVFIVGEEEQKKREAEKEKKKKEKEIERKRKEKEELLDVSLKLSISEDQHIRGIIKKNILNGAPGFDLWVPVLSNDQAVVIRVSYNPDIFVIYDKVYDRYYYDIWSWGVSGKGATKVINYHRNLLKSSVNGGNP